jgi:cobyrinic acid a,c-diamide synthase
MSLIIAAERSGSGKTTITLALLAALRARGQTVQSFKVGPDYIDPMFHAFVTDRPCYNLDLVLTSDAYLKDHFAQKTADVELAIVEGVMGLFDGAAEPAGYGSTANVAKCLNLPVLFVVDCRSISQSIAAVVQGYRSLDPAVTIAGLVLNRVGSDRHLELLQAALEPLGIPIVGVFRREDAIALPDRHLGLIPTDELPELRQVVDQLADLGKRSFDWETLLPLLQVSPMSGFMDGKNYGANIPVASSPVRIAVARDPAFNFYYAANLEQLEALGAELVFWSPLHDSRLPKQINGLYFGGGFPEVFAAQLAENAEVRRSLHTLIQSGLPTYAECGGLMYLCEQIVDFEQRQYPMVGVLPTTAMMGKTLTLGYRSAIAQQDTPLLPKHSLVRGHEFHRSTLLKTSPDPLFKLRRGIQVLEHLESAMFDLSEGWRSPHLHASYLHLHWVATPEYAVRFIQHCQQY